MTEGNYEEDLKINESQLDVEWLEQPVKFMQYSTLSAEANAALRQAEEKIKTVRSELSLYVMANGQELIGKAKPTAGDVEAYYRTHADYLEAKKQQADLAFEAEMLANAVYAMHQRKTALENLTRLHGQNYFAGPSEPRELGEAYKEQHRESIKDAAKETTKQEVRRRTRRTRKSGDA